MGGFLALIKFRMGKKNPLAYKAMLFMSAFNQQIIKTSIPKIIRLYFYSFLPSFIKYWRYKDKILRQIKLLKSLGFFFQWERLLLILKGVSLYYVKLIILIIYYNNNLLFDRPPPEIN